MTTPVLIALAAGTGGVAPSLIHLAQGFIKQSPDVPGPFYFVGVGIFFGLGAVVAYLFAETNARKAFFLGIGLPALVATAQTQGLPKSALSAIVPSAYAQTIAPPASASPSAVSELKFRTGADCKGCELWFKDADGKVIAKEIVGNTSAGVFAVPKGTSTVGVADPKSNPQYVPLPSQPSRTATLEFERTYSPLKDLRRGLGDYDLKSYDSRVKVID